jgi:hypothetical protein
MTKHRFVLKGGVAIELGFELRARHQGHWHHRHPGR